MFSPLLKARRDMEKTVFGLIVAVLGLQLAESVAGESAANWLLFVLILGVAAYHHTQLEKFAADVQARLK
jgi:hypothetical protein